jgi:hypothetical protein
MNENTAHSDLAGEIRVAEGIRDRLRIAAENARPLDTDLSDQWAAEAAALTLLIDAVRGYEAMMDEWERHGWTIGPSGFGPDGKRAWWRVGYTAFADRADMSLHDVDNDSVVGADSLLEAVRLAAFRAVAKEGDE